MTGAQDKAPGERFARGRFVFAGHGLCRSFSGMNNPIAEFSIKCAIAACAVIACLVVAKVLFAPRFEPFGGPCSANVPWAYDTKTGKVVAPAYGKLTEWPADSK